MSVRVRPAEIVCHGFKKKHGAYIYCLCGWWHDSLFDFRNERALKKHIEMHRS